LIQIAELQKKKKIFFISDLHLPLQFSGSANATEQEDKVLAWLDYIKPKTHALFLLGDIFDFWFEYKFLVPKGAIRLLVKLLEFHKAQIPVYFFLGNHDYWCIDYLTQACGVQLFKKPESITICNQSFLIGHGDTFNPNPYHAIFYRWYHSAFLQSLARTVPADWLYGLIHRFVLRKNPIRNNSVFEKKDRIFKYCQEQIEPFVHHDFYIFGHMHAPIIKVLNDSSYYYNIGDWVSHYTYACFDGLALSLLNF
jgi:UDP-2,3-diacylglucosamine hydrolase